MIQFDENNLPSPEGGLMGKTYTLELTTEEVVEAFDPDRTGASWDSKPSLPDRLKTPEIRSLLADRRAERVMTTAGKYLRQHFPELSVAILGTGAASVMELSYKGDVSHKGEGGDR